MLETFFNYINKLSQSFLTFLKILLKSKLFLKNLQQHSEEVIILGNGPSLKNVLTKYTEALQNKVVICVNTIAKTDYYVKLKPTYFIIVSKEFWIPGSIKKDQEKRDSTIQAVIENTSWPLTFFIPYQATSKPDFIKRIRSNPNISVHFFNTTPVEGLRSINHFFMMLGWGMPRPHNVLIPSIMMSIQAGFKNIYLLGADHSWLPMISVDEQNNALINQQHFYDKGQTKSETMHRNSRPRRLHEILEKFMLSFRAYFELKDFAITKNVKIYNCTPGSFIDAFDRADIATVLENKSKKEDTLASKSDLSE